MLFLVFIILQDTTVCENNSTHNKHERTLCVHICVCVNELCIFDTTSILYFRLQELIAFVIIYSASGEIGVFRAATSAPGETDTVPIREHLEMGH